LDSSKLEHIWFNNLPLFDEDKALIACVGLIEYEAVPARHNFKQSIKLMIYD